LRISREIKTAFLVLGGIALFIYGFSFLKGSSLFENDKIIYTVYEEVEGLVPGAKVSINGLTVGKITEIDFLSNSTKILITMSIRDELNFSNKSTALLYETGLIGGMAVAIQPVFDKGKAIVTGDTLMSEVKPGLTELINRQIEPLQAKISSMLSSADSLFLGVSNVLDNDTQLNLKNTLENLSLTTKNLNKASLSLIEILDENQTNLNNTFSNFADTSANLKSITDSIADAKIAVTINEFNKTVQGLNAVVSSIENGEGTLGKLVNDEVLYQNLTKASYELESLLGDLKNHPKRYVHFSLFGKKEKPYLPEENNQ
tara:strand:- start:7323 stop:8270 length:948 start_codon:yes stop_codon:yes gene_type:complete